MIVTVNEYFDTVRKQEAKRPQAQRRSIPSQTEFARAIGVTRQSFSQWLKSPNFRESYIDTIITKMRAYGFDTELSDLVKYVPPDPYPEGGQS